MSTDDYDNPSPWMSKPSKPRSAPQKDKKNSYQSQPPPSKDTKDSYQSQPSPKKDDKGSSSPQKDNKGSSQSQTPSWKDNNKDSSQSSPKNDDKDSDSLSAPRKDESQSPPPPKKDTKDNKDNKDSKDNKDNKDNKNNNDSSSQSSQGKKDDDNDNSPPPPWSTPPPPKKNTPPPPLIMSSRESGTVIKNNGLTTSTKVVVAGIVIGGVLLLIGVMVCWLACCKRKKGRKAHDQMVYYRDNSTGNRSSDYYNSGPRAKNCDDHALKMPHAPDIPSHVSSEQWPEFPPPPPPQAISSDMSSAGFSTGNHQAPLPPPSPSVVLGFSQNGMFSLEDLATATGGFSKDNLLGQGGFGYVHKGILPNGKEVAVKSLKAGSGQGEREFQAEMDIINRVHHRHLVTLVGYCIAGDKRMLVYEFVPNNSLEYHLHGKGQTVIDFPSRLKIALGSAKGFAYLHEDCHPRIIHRDVKAANILLDYNFEPKVADFGLAKLSSDNYTHVSTHIMGTFGYLAPEYASSGKLTEKSDVYSFGIVLLELITGKRPVDVHNPEEDSLVDWSRPIIEDAVEGGEYEELVDPKLDGDYDPHQMLCMIACAAACIRLSAKSRPKMIQIVRALEGETSLDDLKEGMKKCSSSSGILSSGSSEYDSPYSSRKRRSKKHPNNVSQDLTSSTELGTTGEFSAQPSPLRSIGSSQEFIRRLNL